LALLARRKTGKTALMERLFNIISDKNDGVIPFYYEVKNEKIWMVDFCQDFFLTFIYPYMPFKTRNVEYVPPTDKSDFKITIHIAQKEGLDYLIDVIEGVARANFFLTFKSPTRPLKIPPNPLGLCLGGIDG
jgi:hypothetical protein